MKDVTLVAYLGSCAFVTTLANEEKFKDEVFGNPESQYDIEDFTRLESVNSIAIRVDDNTEVE